jgi:acetyltransferase-like isoleucine patch superfamily enzyme
MKAKYSFQKTCLSNHVELPFFENLAHIAKEHEYRGVFGILWFYLVVFKDYCLHLLARILPFSSIVVFFHRLRGVTIGNGVHISPGVIIDDVYPCLVKIGDRVSLAGNNFILTHSKPMKFHSKVSASYRAPVIIEDDAWVAIGVIVLPGVRIGRGSIIASGSVVTKSIPPFVLAAGSPAIVKKDIAELVRHNFTEEEFSQIMRERFEQYNF